MTGKRYYFTTIGAWRRHAGRCAETHFVKVDGPRQRSGDGVGPQQAGATNDGNGVPVERTQAEACATGAEQTQPEGCATDTERAQAEACATDDATPILALIDADEGAHLAMENDAEFEALPHPLARVSVSRRVSAALVQFGVAHGDDTFTVAEKMARVNPLLRHRVF